MKMARVLCVVAAVAMLPHAARAELPFTGEALGTIEGTFDFCARIKPDAAAKYAALLRRLLRDLAEEEVAQVQDSDEYKQAYEKANLELSEAPKEEADASCGSILDQEELTS